MISESKMKHIIGVARKCKSLAEIFVPVYLSDNFFMMGYLHDVGYESSKEGHAIKSYLYCRNFGMMENCYIEAIRMHGTFIEKDKMTLEYAILVYSDLTTDHLGNTVAIKDRVNSIKNRYGTSSQEYLVAEVQKKELKRYFEYQMAIHPHLRENIKKSFIFEEYSDEKE